MNKTMLKKLMLMLVVVGWGWAGWGETTVFSSASSETFVLDTTFEEGSEISNRLEIAYGSVGAGACRVEVDGEPLIESVDGGTVNRTTLTEGEHTFVWQSADCAMTTTVNVVELVWPPSPVISPASGTAFDSSLTVTMSCAMDGASIFYTVDGREPTMASTSYKRFKISSKTTVKAVAYRDGYYSDVATSEYALGQCADPSVSPADGTVFTHSGQEVSIAQNGDEGVLRYTLDGSDPTAASPVYTGPFMVDDTTVVKAKVFSDRYFDSAVVTVNLTRDWETVATPVITAAAEFTGRETEVALVCATPGATIRYTTNGSEPNSHSPLYMKPFWVSESCTVKAVATCAEYLASAVASLSIAKVWGIGDTLGAPDHVFTTSGDADFFRVEDATAPGGEAMRSGDVGDSTAYGLYARSVLSTMVRGPGTLAFSWRSSCEQDDDYEWDHAELAVDGVVVARINDVTDWRKVTQAIEGAGEHVVTWTYLKDDAEKEGDDCLWVAGYSWTPAEPWTHESSVPVPYDWILSYLPHTAPEYERFEAAVREFAANGVNSVEEAYVAGLDPTDVLSQLTADITMTNDVPYVTWSPNLNTNGEVRVYKVWGKARLDDADEQWTYPTNGTHRFFKVSVEMK